MQSSQESIVSSYIQITSYVLEENFTFFFIAVVNKEDTGLLSLPLWMVYIQAAGIDKTL